jgi:dihydroneopterin aldolase
MILEHYAGSVSFDTDNQERSDQIVTALRYKDLVEKIQNLMKHRKNPEVHFACHKVGKKEFDLTEKIKSEIS